MAGDPLAAQVEGLAPELALSEIAWGGTHATHVGRRVVGHLPLDEYRVTVDLERALARAKRAGRPAVAAAIASELQRGGARRVPVTIWVNGPGYVAQLEKAAPGTGLGTTSYSFSGFAAEVQQDAARPGAGRAARRDRPSGALDLVACIGHVRFSLWR